MLYIGLPSLITKGIPIEIIYIHLPGYKLRAVHVCSSHVYDTFYVARLTQWQLIVIFLMSKAVKPEKNIKGLRNIQPF